MQLRTKLSLVLVGILPIGALAPACSTQTSTAKQLITCSTDPGTGVILRCQPGGTADGSNSCQDIDEDGDGEPHDEGDDHGENSGHDGSDDKNTTAPGGGGGGSSSDDSDGDGVPDDHDCDNHPGEDRDHADSDLPYDVRPQLGASTRPIFDAFAAKGKQPAAIVSVTMEGGGNWRLTELQAGTAFTVAATDCSHAGNREVGRDRVIVTWRNADNTTHSDHLDIRYCKN